MSYHKNGKHFTGGGTGFRVTFKSDGTEIVDYTPMQPIRVGGNDILSYEGKASARISTKDGVARIETMVDAGARLHAVFPTTHTDWNPKIPGLGAGGLPSAKARTITNARKIRWNTQALMRALSTPPAR